MKSYPRDLTEALVRRFELTPVQCYVYDLLKDFYFYIERAPSTEEIINLFKNSCQDEIQFVVQRYYTNINSHWVNEEFEQAIRKEQEQIEKNKLISQKRSMAVRSRRDRQKSTKVATSVNTSVDTYVATSEHTHVGTHVDTRDATQVEPLPFSTRERTNVRTHERSDVISGVPTHVGTSVSETTTNSPESTTKKALLSSGYETYRTEIFNDGEKNDSTCESTLVATNEEKNKKSPNSTLVATCEENPYLSTSYNREFEESPRTCARVTGPDTYLIRSGPDRDDKKELDEIFNIFESFGFVRRSLQKHRDKILLLIEEGLTVKIVKDSLQEAKDWKEKRNEKDFRHAIKYVLTIVESNLATQRAKREVRKAETSESLSPYEEEERRWQEHRNDPKVREGIELLAKVTEELRNEK